MCLEPTHVQLLDLCSVWNYRGYSSDVGNFVPCETVAIEHIWARNPSLLALVDYIDGIIKPFGQRSQEVQFGALGVIVNRRLGHG